MGLKVFISHATKDDELAQEIGTRLADDGHKVFGPVTDILGGQDWARETTEALSRSDAMIVLISPEAMESRNVRHEISFALGSARYEGRVVPVIVRPTSEVPWILQTFQQIDVSVLSPQDVADRVSDVFRKLERKAS